MISFKIMYFMNYVRCLRRQRYASAFTQKLEKVTEVGFDSQLVVPDVKTHISRSNLDRFKS